jgi:hypothetical protein
MISLDFVEQSVVILLCLFEQFVSVSEDNFAPFLVA